MQGHVHTQMHTHLPAQAHMHAHTHARRGASWDRDTNVTMPQLLWEASPWLRNVIIFRDPVERYTSAFYYYRHVARCPWLCKLMQWSAAPLSFTTTGA